MIYLGSVRGKLNESDSKIGSRSRIVHAVREPLGKGSDGSRAQRQGMVCSLGEAPKQRINSADTHNSGAELTGLNQLVDVHRRSRLGSYRLCRLLVGQAPLTRARKITGFHLNRVTPLCAAPSEHLRARLA